MSWVYAAMLYRDRDHYGTETIAEFARSILDTHGHSCRYCAMYSVLSCERCELYLHRWAIVKVLRRFYAKDGGIWPLRLGEALEP